MLSSVIGPATFGAGSMLFGSWFSEMPFLQPAWPSTDLLLCIFEASEDSNAGNVAALLWEKCACVEVCMQHASKTDMASRWRKRGVPEINQVFFCGAH